MNLKTIREKKYIYEDFLKIAFFYYNKYKIINSIANSKFSFREKKKLKLNEFEYSIQFSNIDYRSKNRKDNSILEHDEKNENYDEIIYLNSSISNEEETLNINNNKSNEIENISKQNYNDIIGEEKNEFLQKKRKNENINNKNQIYEQIKNNNNNNSELNKRETNKFNQNNIEIKFNQNFNSYENDKIMNFTKIPKKHININLKNKRQQNNYTEENPSKDLLIRISNDKEYKEFKKELSDYLKRIIGEKREKNFLNKLLPESVEIMKKLFKKDLVILPNTTIPIYRNDYLEYSLIIENQGKIDKKILYIKE